MRAGAGNVFLATKITKTTKREEDSDFLCLDKAEVVTLEVAWTGVKAYIRQAHFGEMAVKLGNESVNGNPLIVHDEGNDVV